MRGRRVLIGALGICLLCGCSNTEEIVKLLKPEESTIEESSEEDVSDLWIPHDPIEENTGEGVEETPQEEVSIPEEKELDYNMGLFGNEPIGIVRMGIWFEGNQLHLLNLGVPLGYVINPLYTGNIIGDGIEFQMINGETLGYHPFEGLGGASVSLSEVIGESLDGIEDTSNYYNSLSKEVSYLDSSSVDGTVCLWASIRGNYQNEINSAKNVTHEKGLGTELNPAYGYVDSVASDAVLFYRINNLYSLRLEYRGGMLEEKGALYVFDQLYNLVILE